MPNAELVRPSLTDTLIEAVRDRILHGRLTAGRPLVEADLAAELGVSRTPLRESLVALERDGFVSRIPNRGFFVVPLTDVEAAETYPLVGALEALALRLAAGVDEPALARLERRNGALLEPGLDPRERLRLDADWHRQLLAGCANGKLHALLERLKHQLLRYEHAYMAEAGSVATSVQEHEAVLEALRRGARRRAATLLERHWQAGGEIMSRRLRRADIEEPA